MSSTTTKTLLALNGGVKAKLPGTSWGQPGTEVIYVATEGDILDRNYNSFAGDLDSHNVDEEIGVRPAIWVNSEVIDNPKLFKGKETKRK